MPSVVMPHAFTSLGVGFHISPNPRLQHELWYLCINYFYFSRSDNWVELVPPFRSLWFSGIQWSGRHFKLGMWKMQPAGCIWCMQLLSYDLQCCLWVSSGPTGSIWGVYPCGRCSSCFRTAPHAAPTPANIRSMPYPAHIREWPEQVQHTV